MATLGKWKEDIYWCLRQHQQAMWDVALALFDSYPNNPCLLDTSESLDNVQLNSKDPAQKTYTYQFDVAKRKIIPSVGGVTIRTAAQSGIGIRYGRCTGTKKQ